jgi:hypothetical protein
MRRKKPIEPIPEKFASYEEAAEFWDTHDTTDYPNAFRTVEVETDLRQRRYEIEIDEDLIKKLRAHARRRGVSPSALANDLLRQRLAPK